jgi:hypothetical protein
MIVDAMEGMTPLEIDQQVPDGSGPHLVTYIMENATPKVSRALKSLFNSGRYPRSASRELSREEPVPSLSR